MALKKAIRKQNGVALSYHRIAMVKVDTNQQITILVQSYIDEEGRNYEKKYANGEIEGEPTFPYTQGDYLYFDYSENSDLFKGNIVKKAYSWLKKHPDYIGSEDI